MATIHSEPEVFKALREAGLSDNQTRRVIIDIDVNCAVVIYTEKYGDEKILDVVRTLGKDDVKTEIKFVDSDGEVGAG